MFGEQGEGEAIHTKRAAAGVRNCAGFVPEIPEVDPKWSR